MPIKQLSMFDPYRPLLEKLGHEFFHKTPTKPGVYTMLGSDGKILYIGQSGNLHHRLATYKNTRVGQGSRKTFRLVQKVDRILWTVCPTPEVAEKLEASLIRKHRPTFNRQHTWPATWFYISLAKSDSGLCIRLQLEPDSHGNETVHGAFKGLSVGRRTIKALARLLWTLDHRPASPFEFPHAFSGRLERWTMTAPDRHQPGFSAKAEHLGDYLSGRSMALVSAGRLCLNIPATEEDTPPDLTIVQRILSDELDHLEDFFHKGPADVLAKSQSIDRSLQVVPPELLDPSLAEWDQLTELDAIDRHASISRQREFTWDS